ncbi:MAG: hypothetical protein JXR48_02110 [Candidatus Delongbacteria bacterium]|nr:hypothetical protein [Candidatus Delongbacteria bacterium]MBN2833740.1 hypothetical protein [Candidatus Delongbacteria bacterium]
MENNRFYKIVWRLNAIVILIAGIIAIFILLFVGYNFYRDFFGSRFVPDAINVSENNNIQETRSLGYLQRIEGTNFICIPFETDQTYAHSYFSKSLNSYRNYLFIDLETNEQNWLLENNNHLITQTDFIFENDGSLGKNKVLAIMYSIVKSDNNSDKMLNEKDKITIALSNTSGKNYYEILTSVDRLIGFNMVNENEIIIIYMNDSRGYSIKVSLEDYKILSKVEIKWIVG